MACFYSIVAFIYFIVVFFHFIAFYIFISQCFLFISWPLLFISCWVFDLSINWNRAGLRVESALDSSRPEQQIHLRAAAPPFLNPRKNIISLLICIWTLSVTIAWRSKVMAYLTVCTLKRKKRKKYSNSSSYSTA